ncbi:hypothetical protein [Cellulosimicrobium sp. Marseille-Q4280]|uniref:hypothetical protein n=1 Tax=Cellulosimicrobium sp. Marseille-Q4280 TaxID=2937992 RepID=UPI002042110A|nr:hypothetical protein [Cellulosimicrobium sp. Marseille-Q4280]
MRDAVRRAESPQPRTAVVERAQHDDRVVPHDDVEEGAGVQLQAHHGVPCPRRRHLRAP